MAIWPFNRRKANDTVPQEIQEYYQAERRERVGMAWMLALATLVLTVLLVFGVFFGGRWVYRNVRDNDNNQAPTATEPADQQQQSNQTPGNQQNEAQPQTPQTSQPPAQQQQPQQQNPPTATNPPQQPTPQSTPQTDEQLPRTGPADVAAIFVIATAAGTVAHSWFMSRRRQLHYDE